VVNERLSKPVLHIKMFLSPSYASFCNEAGCPQRKEEINSTYIIPPLLGQTRGLGKDQVATDNFLRTPPSSSQGGWGRCRGEQRWLKREGQVRRGDPPNTTGDTVTSRRKYVIIT